MTRPKLFGTGDSFLTDAESEFVAAMYDYQKKYNRRFPAWSEAFRVLLKLGYRKFKTLECPYCHSQLLAEEQGAIEK